MSKLIIVTSMLIPSLLQAQQVQQDSLQDKREVAWRFSGQLSGWGQYSPDIPTRGWLGGRYIPQANIEIPLYKDSKQIDFEASANIYGDLGIVSLNDFKTEGSIKPYRAWARYSSSKMEVRLGLQKINFGSAQMFRPLMWFDSMDPRDPLQLTDGVWGALFRYYFQNNANIWLWGLYGNNDQKGWETTPSSNAFPEMGGRVQIPIPKGEGALSYHFRKTDVDTYGFREKGTSNDGFRDINARDEGFVGADIPNNGFVGTDVQNYVFARTDVQNYGFGTIPENRFGIDIRLDVTIGLWLESSWTHLSRDMGEFTNQQMMTLGADYTFGIGNGLGVTFEQFFYSHSKRGINLNNALNFSALNFSYPLTLFDNIGAIVYWDWENRRFYNFLHWQHQLNNITFHAIGYWNPKEFGIPAQMGSTDRFAGKGIQLMVVWHH